MCCIEAIRQAIDALPQDAVFTSRDFVKYGYRTTVDQSISRLIKKQFITRVSRGVFIKFGARWPSVFEVAFVKAKSFGRELVCHGQRIASELSLLLPEQEVNSGEATEGEQIGDEEAEWIFQISGHSSSFILGKRRVCLRGACPRIIQLGESESGRFIRALWFIGKTLGTHQLQQLVSKYTTETLLNLLSHSAWMPGWLSHQLRLASEIHDGNLVPV